MESIKERVQREVNMLYQKNGHVTPSALIREAEPESSPIHDAFEWDNQKAGEQYRLIQSRGWLRVVRIVRDDVSEPLVHVPVIRIEKSGDEQETREGYYKPVSMIAQDEDEYNAAFSEVNERLAAAKRAYKELKRAAREVEPQRVPDFIMADRGFEMVETALG